MYGAFDTHRILNTDTTMIETKSQPQVRDLTAAPRRIPIEDDGAAVYDLILALWAVFNPKEEAQAFELGSAWFDALTKRAPAGLREEVQALGGPYCGVWLAVAGLAASAPHPHDPTRVIEWLSRVDPQRLRRWILGYAGHFRNSGLIDQAADGDLDALDALLDDAVDEEQRAEIIAVLAIDPEELRDRLVRALTLFRAEVYAPDEEAFAAAVGRAAAARRAIANLDDAKTVIEQVTNGLDYEIPLGVTRVILVPSVVLRPLAIIDQFRDTLLVFYAVADEFLDSDPEAPPSWMVRTYKALSDERRLRILRRFAEGETTLDELTELLGLSKSTVHHHISVLRGGRSGPGPPQQGKGVKPRDQVLRASRATPGQCRKPARQLSPDLSGPRQMRVRDEPIPVLLNSRRLPGQRPPSRCSQPDSQAGDKGASEWPTHDSRRGRAEAHRHRGPAGRSPGGCDRGFGRGRLSKASP